MWSARIGAKVENIEKSLASIEGSGGRLSSFDNRLSIMSQQVSDLRADLAGINGMLAGLLRSLPPPRRARAFGIEPAAIEKIALQRDKVETINARNAQPPVSLTVTVMAIKSDAVVLRLDGSIGKLDLEDVRIQVPLRLGAVVMLPVKVTDTPEIYFAVLERHHDSLLIGIGERTKDDRV
jgi:hypothetical protein